MKIFTKTIRTVDTILSDFSKAVVNWTR